MRDDYSLVKGCLFESPHPQWARRFSN